YPVHERILAIQRVVLDHALDTTVLARIQDNAMRQDSDPKVKPLEMAEVFRGLTEAIWNDPTNGARGPKKPLELSIVKRNLQREHVKHLTALVLSSGSAPPDAKSLARMHLKEVQARIGRLLNDKTVVADDTSRAHLQETSERIAKVLGASMRVAEP